MTRLEIDEELKGGLGEFYFKHFCRQHNYMYAKVEDISREFNARDQIITFSNGFSRIPVRIPSAIQTEIFRASRPTNDSSDSPSFAVDFLTCTNWRDDGGDNPADFVWAEVKTGRSEIRNSQKKFARNCRLRYCVFRVPNVMLPPQRIQVVWEEDIPMKGD